MKNRKEIIIAVVTLILMILGAIFGVTYTDDDISTIVNGVDTIVDIVETAEIPNLKQEDEQILEVQETNLENEAFERQGEVAYNGSDKTPNIKLGEYKGLTYYSQADSRWANHMYSAINDKSQTMIASGCGPTSASIVVSSIKGEITPPEMADLFVKYGYRSANSGTYWSAFKWTADVFDIGFQQTSSFNTMLSKLKDNNYVVAICKEGLFTYGGHFIVIVGIDGDTLKIYDPYLYNGKFNTSTRKGKATVSGNTVYVTTSNFKKYANAQGYFCFKNDRTDVKENNNDISINNNLGTVKSVNYKVKVTANAGLNIRTGASTSYKKIDAYTKNTVVTVTAENNGWGKTSKGWICLSYTNKVSSSSNTSTKVNYKTGTYQVTASVLNVRSGAGTNYSKKTYKQLTSNARNQNKKLGNYYTNGYRKGTKCTVSKVSGNWGKTPSGWICLNYCKKV